MESPGEYLKREREIRGIRLEAISDATKIRTGLLAAIERNDFDALPTAPFVKGFIQAYCKYLGVDVQDALLRYEAYMRSIAEKEASALKQGIEAKNQKPDARSANPPIYIISIAVIAGLIILSGLYVISKKQPPSYSSFRETSQPSEIQPKNMLETKTAEAPLPASEKPEDKADTTIDSTASKMPLKDAKQQGNVADKGQLTVVIKASQPSWLKTEIDGQNPFEVSLKQGETITWHAKEKLSVLIGNAGGVDVLLNGKPLGKLGDEGKVVKLVLPKQKPHTTDYRPQPTDKDL